MLAKNYLCAIVSKGKRRNKKAINTNALFVYDNHEKPIADVIKGMEYFSSLGFESLVE